MYGTPVIRNLIKLTHLRKILDKTFTLIQSNLIMVMKFIILKEWVNLDYHV